MPWRGKESVRRGDKELLFDAYRVAGVVGSFKAIFVPISS
jgi:hypothetical protein